MTPTDILWRPNCRGERLAESEAGLNSELPLLVFLPGACYFPKAVSSHSKEGNTHLSELTSGHGLCRTPATKPVTQMAVPVNVWSFKPEPEIGKCCVLSY